VFSLSTNAKEAIKVGLAMTIAYYVALRFSWMSSTWPAIAVAFISLPTAGQSINKGLLRIGGTLVAFAAGLFFLALFPQDRWYFFLAFTPYLAFVTYKMTGKGGQYLWFCAAFVSMMIITAGPGKGNAFEFAVYRTFETIVGVVIWTVVSVFLWPRSNRKTLVSVSRDLGDALEQLLDAYRKELLEQGTGDGLQDLRARAGKLAGQLGQTIGAAASESYEVREVRHLWERLHGLSVSMLEVLDRLQTGLEELKQFDIEAAVGDLTAFFAVQDSRLRTARGMLGGESPSGPREATPAQLGAPRIEGLNHFQRAAAEGARSELEQLEPLTRALVECVRDIEGREAREVSPGIAPAPQPITGFFGLPPLDPDRVRATLMVVASMWSASLVWIYFNPPGHASWYQFVPNIALVVAQYPQARLTLMKPLAYAYTATLTLYVFLMPQLSTFWQLGPLIFAITFVAAYFFAGAVRPAIYLAMFNMLGISNQQGYDFAAQANAFLFTMMGIMMVVGLSYITRSPRPEKAFLSMLRRFVRAWEFLVSELGDSTDGGSVLQRMKRAYYLQELRSLPEKLGVWGKQIDSKKFPRNSPARLDEIVSRVQTLAHRIEELREARRAPQATLLVEELGDEFRAWRLVIERGLEEWLEHSGAEPADDLRGRLTARLTRLNARIEETSNHPETSRIADQERRSFYRLLGGFRGLSQAAMAYADSAGSIDWAEWREERF
jgi:uncharacterized membrane protein YccC